MKPVEFFVPGHPRPQGSKSFKGMRNGKPVLVESSEHLPAWRNTVMALAMSVRGRAGGVAIGYPVRVEYTFTFRRPKSNASDWPVQRWVGDLDKLERAVNDGMVEGGLLADDSLIVQSAPSKVWGEKQGVRVRITNPEAS